MMPVVETAAANITVSGAVVGDTVSLSGANEIAVDMAHTIKQVVWDEVIKDSIGIIYEKTAPYVCHTICICSKTLICTSLKCACNCV